MSTVIDFHAHVFENPVSQFSTKVPIGPLRGALSSEKFQLFRDQARQWIKPISSTLHGAQTLFRYFPGIARKGLDELGSLLSLPSLLIESTLDDLLLQMTEAQVDYTVIIAHPPFISNDFVMKISAHHPQLLPVVNIPQNQTQPATALKNYAQQGAKALKIHPSADGAGPDSEHYHKLIKTASQLELPIILHTGCIHSHILYKDPDQSRAENFKKWFESYPDARFILAHMNFHEPTVAMDLCEEFPNLYVDTSWQPAETIGEAARRIGAERILFGTDWPLIGNNMTIGKKRILECIEIGMLNQIQAQLILGENAVQLLGLSTNAV